MTDLPAGRDLDDLDHNALIGGASCEQAGSHAAAKAAAPRVPVPAAIPSDERYDWEHARRQALTDLFTLPEISDVLDAIDTLQPGRSPGLEQYREAAVAIDRAVRRGRAQQALPFARYWFSLVRDHPGRQVIINSVQTDTPCLWRLPKRDRLVGT